MLSKDTMSHVKPSIMALVMSDFSFCINLTAVPKKCPGYNVCLDLVRVFSNSEAKTYQTLKSHSLQSPLLIHSIFFMFFLLLLCANCPAPSLLPKPMWKANSSGQGQGNPLYWTCAELLLKVTEQGFWDVLLHYNLLLVYSSITIAFSFKYWKTFVGDRPKHKLRLIVSPFSFLSY